MSQAQFITTMFRYKAWANDEMLNAVQRFDEERHAPERHAAIYLLNHTYIVDRIFADHLCGRTHGYLAATERENPPLDKLSHDIRRSDAWYVNYTTGLTGEELAESIDFTFTDGALGRMSRAEMLVHALMHGGYHRGAIGRIMAQLSIRPPGDVLTGYLHKTEGPARRRML